MASIVDYLNQIGQPSDFASRAKLAASKGIQNYTGTASQNLQLLETVKTQTAPPQPQNGLNGPFAPGQNTYGKQITAPVPTAPPNAPATAPTQTPAAAPDEQALISAMVGKGHTVESAKAAIAGRGVTDLSREYLQAPGGITGGAGGSSFSPLAIPTIDLPKLYQGLYESSGINQKQEELSTKEKQYLEAKAKISDNPWLNASQVDKRLARLSALYDTETAGLRNEIATKKADVETQLSLQTKQFDINSQQAKQSLDQFNTLLSAGALTGASGEDIANITRATGLSSSMIQSAINAAKAKNIQTSTISFDDGTNQGFAIINSQTGDIINKQVVSQSKPKAAWVTATKQEEERQNQENAMGDIKRGVTLRDLITHYGVSGGVPIEDLYRLYNSYSPYGNATEDIEDVKQGKFSV